MNRKIKKNQTKTHAQGFSMIEALIGIAILSTTTMFALSSIDLILKNRKNTQIATSVISIQQSIIAAIKNQQSWNNIIQANQPSMACLRNNQDILTPDCSTVITTPNWPQLIAMDSSNNVLFNPTDSASGFSLKGLQTCNTFVAPPGAGDIDCPLRADIRWRPICGSGIPANKCRWPNIEVHVTFQYNPGGNATYSLNPKNIEVTIVRSVGLCPKQVPSVNAAFPDPNDSLQWIANGSVTLFGNSFSKPVAGDLADNGNTLGIYSCNNYDISFKYDLVSSAPNPDNLAIVCITPAGNDSCLYEWRQFQGSWFLYEGGALVYTKPATTPFNSTITLGFKVISGNVSFYSNGLRAYTFTNALAEPYKVYFNPARSTYSTKISDITFTPVN